MPLVDQDGNESEQLEVEIAGKGFVAVSKIVVRHSEILLFEDGEPAIQISRPTHPGAGLELDLADSVETV